MLQNLCNGNWTFVQEMAYAVCQQATTYTNVDPVLCYHMASQGQNELTPVKQP